MLFDGSARAIFKFRSGQNEETSLISGRGLPHFIFSALSSRRHHGMPDMMEKTPGRRKRWWGFAPHPRLGLPGLNPLMAYDDRNVRGQRGGMFIAATANNSRWISSTKITPQHTVYALLSKGAGRATGGCSTPAATPPLQGHFPVG